jgi:hypothetical protein
VGFRCQVSASQVPNMPIPLERDEVPKMNAFCRSQVLMKD